MIGRQLETDRDLLSLMSVNRQIHATISAPGAGVFRAFFARRFDPSRYPSGSQLRWEYTRRGRILGTPMRFTFGRTGWELVVLNLLRTLILGMFILSMKSRSLLTPAPESCPGPAQAESDVSLTRNQLQMLRFVSSTNLLSDLFVIPANPSSGYGSLLQTIQLVLSHFALRQGPGYRGHSFAVSQKAVYARSAEIGVFHGTKKDVVNVDWALHVLNFFRRHVADFTQATIFWAYRRLGAAYRPNAWVAKLCDPGAPQMIGRYWTGSYGKRHPSLTP